MDVPLTSSVETRERNQVTCTSAQAPYSIGSTKVKTAFERRKEAVSRFYKRNPTKRMVWHARSRAKQMGLDFDITAADVSVPTQCPVLGLRLEFGDGVKTDASPSIDRIDSSKGYTKDNIWVISWKANRLKSNATLEDVVRIAAAMALQEKNIQGER
jgi:hypothetical protein